MDPKKLVAEAIGTFWLTFGGCGSAVIAAAFPQVGIGLLGVALAFGLTVLTMAYTIGHVSGCHLNPAVTVGLTCGGRFPPALVLPYIVAQVVGAIAATSVPLGTSMRAAAARLVTNSSAALRAPICRSSGQSCHWCSMHGSASAAKPCRRSWMTTLSACGCDLVMSQVKDKVDSVMDVSPGEPGMRQP